MGALRVNLRCADREACRLDPADVVAPRLVRQNACSYQEAVQLPCEACGALVETLIRY
jgi:hypothetical protein